MPLNLEGLRIEVARAMYDDSMGSMEGSPSWFNLPDEVKAGFLKFAGVCFAKLWEKDTKDVVDFFCGHVWKVLPGCGVPTGTSHCGDRLNGKKIMCNNCKNEVLFHEAH